MEYTVSKLSRMAGVSARTLRHYDQIGLLAPARVSQSGYRLYGPEQADILQQILFYRGAWLFAAVHTQHCAESFVRQGNGSKGTSGDA